MSKKAVSSHREISTQQQLTIGIDLGDQYSHYCILDGSGAMVEEGRVRSTPEAFTKHFMDGTVARIAMEAGSHSQWASRLLQEFGHEVMVADPRKIPGITGSNKKSNRNDAEKLAHYARFGQELLSPIHHRSEQMQADLAVFRVREQFVKTRTMTINAARGIVKSFGCRLPKCSSSYFVQRCRDMIPEMGRTALEPLFEQIALLNAAIKRSDQQIEELAREKYREAAVLRSVHGVGPICSLGFVLTLGDPSRFRQSRMAGCYLGLRPGRSQSGNSDPQLGITKAGDSFLSKVLVQCAHRILGPWGPDSLLRRWGLRLADRGGKNGKKRAIIAVARKLSVLLHKLWVTQKPYDPFYGCPQAIANAQ